MQCDSFEDRVNQVLDERMSPHADAELQQHARCCSSCAHFLDASVRIFCGVDGDYDSPPVNRSFGSQALRASRKLSYFAGALAALLLVSLVTPRPESVTPAVKQVVSHDLQPAWQASEASSEAHAELSPGSSTAFVHQPLISLGLLSATDWQSTIDDVPMPFGAQLPEVQSRLLGAVSDGMLPVQQSMTKTFDAIKRSLSS